MKSRNTGLLFNRFVLRAELIKKREKERERMERGEWKFRRGGEGGGGKEGERSWQQGGRFLIP